MPRKNKQHEYAAFIIDTKVALTVRALDQELSVPGMAKFAPDVLIAGLFSKQARHTSFLDGADTSVVCSRYVREGALAIMEYHDVSYSANFMTQSALYLETHIPTHFPKWREIGDLFYLLHLTQTLPNADDDELRLLQRRAFRLHEPIDPNDKSLFGLVRTKVMRSLGKG